MKTKMKTTPEVEEHGPPSPLRVRKTTPVEERPITESHGTTSTQVVERPTTEPHASITTPVEERPRSPLSTSTTAIPVRSRSASVPQRMTKRPDTVERPAEISAPHMWGRGAIISALKDKAAQQQRQDLLTGLHDVISLGGFFDITNQTTVIGSMPLELTDHGLRAGDLQWLPGIDDKAADTIASRQTGIKEIQTLKGDIQRSLRSTWPLTTAKTQAMDGLRDRITTLADQINALTGQQVTVAGTTDELANDIGKLERQIPLLMKQITSVRKQSPKVSSLQSKVMDPLKAHVEKILSDSGQLEMLRQHAKEGFDYDVSIDYFHLRSLADVGFHKDTLGQTLFIHLAFSNDKPILGTEWIVDMGPGNVGESAALWPYEENLPKWFQSDLLEARNRWKQVASQSGPTSDAYRIWGKTLDPFSTVSFNDPLITHTTPDITSRQDATNKLGKAQLFVEESGGARVQRALPSPSMATRPRSHSDAQAFAGSLPADTKDTPRSFIRLEVRAKPQTQKTPEAQDGVQ